MKRFIGIGPELYSELEYRIEIIHESLDDLADVVADDIPELFADRVELTRTAYDIVSDVEAAIRSYGLKDYKKMWNEIREFHIECGSATVFDRPAYERGDLMSSRGLKGLIWFRYKGMDYSFNEHPEFVFRGKTYDYHKHPVG